MGMGVIMRKQSSPVALIGAGLSTLAIVGAGAYFLKDTLPGFLKDILPGAAPQLAASPSSAPSASSRGDMQIHLSRGEKVLFTEVTNPDKQAAVEAIAANDFPTAVAKLTTARQSLRNDPETLIYLNNARLGNIPALTFAAVVPISSSATSASEILRGVAQAQDESILAGVPLRIEIGDDGNSPEQAVAIANTLVQDNSISAVIGHGTSQTSLAAAPIYQQGQIVMMAPTSTSTQLVQIPKGATGNFVFRTIPSDQFTGTTLARYMLSLGKRKAVVFYNSASSYSNSLQQAFTTTLSLEGGEVIKQVDLSQGQAAEQLTGTPADILVLLPDSETLNQAIEVAKVNRGRLPVLAGDAFYRIESLQKGGSALNDTVLSVPWHPLSSADPQFVKTATQLWGGNVNWRTALSYDALQALRSARSVGKVTPDSGVQGRVALAQALNSSGFTARGTTGSISFLPSGDRNSNVILIKIQPGSQSKTGYDFVPLQSSSNLNK